MSSKGALSSQSIDARIIARCARGYDWNETNDDEPLYFGNDNDVSVKWDSTNSVLEFLPLTDDTGAINVGDGTTDMDVKIFLGGTTEYVLFDVGNAKLTLSAGVTLDASLGTISLAAGSIDTAELANSAVTSVKWASGAGVAAILTAGLGNSASYIVSSNGVSDLLAAGVALNAVIVIAVVDTVFANGDGAQPTFTVGDESTAASFFAAATFTDAAAGTVFVAAGETASAEKVQVTSTAGTGTTETGAISFTVLALPTA